MGRGVVKAPPRLACTHLYSRNPKGSFQKPWIGTLVKKRIGGLVWLSLLRAQPAIAGSGF
jgi:hypothetical protein